VTPRPVAELNLARVGRAARRYGLADRVAMAVVGEVGARLDGEDGAVLVWDSARFRVQHLVVGIAVGRSRRHPHARRIDRADLPGAPAVDVVAVELGVAGARQRPVLGKLEVKGYCASRRNS
jgi:hypothetical protein